MPDPFRRIRAHQREESDGLLFCAAEEPLDQKKESAAQSLLGAQNPPAIEMGKRARPTSEGILFDADRRFAQRQLVIADENQVPARLRTCRQDDLFAAHGCRGKLPMLLAGALMVRTMPLSRTLV